VALDVGGQDGVLGQLGCGHDRIEALGVQVVETAFVAAGLERLDGRGANRVVENCRGRDDRG